jgi:hypothetical protein
MVDGMRGQRDEKSDSPAGPLPQPEEVPNGDVVPMDVDINRT